MEEITVVSDGEFLVFKSDSEKDLEMDVYYGYDSSKMNEGKKFLFTMTERQMIIKNPDLNHRLFFLVCPKEGKNYVISTRLVNLDGTYNFRDCGGYETIEGRRVKWGLLYRSDQLSNISERDVAFLKNMGLKTIVDYRSKSEASAAPNKEISDANTYSLDPNAKIAQLAADSIDDVNKSILDLLKEHKFYPEKYGDPEENMYKQYKKFIYSDSSKKAYRELIKLILDEHNLPLVQHCRGGKDRTGFGVAIILLALGVREECVIYDYTLTTQYRVTKNKKQMNLYKKYTKDEQTLTLLSTLQQSKAIYMETAINEMKKTYGSIDSYLKDALGIDQDVKEKLKEIFLYEEC
ncbi:tyrosine-protein phosphatase [Catenibacterium mitsuokai]|uniref:tyrosine-protein phosphatase n=1 Tax=Catenibacterium mitsuokai TaxID=100886 RepID=UPI003F933829